MAGSARDAIPPVPPKTAKSGPQPPKSAIESHLRIAESFRVHGPVSTSEFAAVSTPPPRNNSLRYTEARDPKAERSLRAEIREWLEPVGRRSEAMAAGPAVRISALDLTDPSLDRPVPRKVPYS